MTNCHVPITPATCYVDGSVGAGFSVEWWAACDWSKAYLDRGPSPKPATPAHTCTSCARTACTGLIRGCGAEP